MFKSSKGDFVAISNIEKVEDIIQRIPESSAEISDKKIINGGNSFDISGHSRKLSAGRKASAKKIAQAKELGIELAEGWTRVDGYTKNCA